jgi:glycosyltransferase involved in cell wall biosynthesis
MKTVLIFAHECAPHNNPRSVIGAQRPAQFAKHLREFGWRAVVLCCDNERRRRADKDEAIRAAREDAKMALAQAAPDEPVIIATPGLSHDGWLDRSWRATFTPAGPRRGKPVVIARKALTALKFRRGDWSQNWQPCARAAAEIVAEKLKIDVVLGEHGPDAGLFLARWFAAKHDVPWVIDFRDPMVQQYRGATRKLYTRTACDLLKTASGTIAVNPFLAELDKEMFGRPAWTITNGYDPDEFTAADAANNERLTVTYVGNIIPEQRLDTFLQGLRAAETPVRFVYRGGLAEQIKRQAAQYGVADLLDCGGQVARTEALTLMQRADVLLLLSIANPSEADIFLSRGVYPGKVFEYFGARKPILCVPGDGAMLDELLSATRAGAVARDAAAVAAFLTQAEAERENGGLAYAPDTKLLEQYTRRNLSRLLAEILEGVAQSS